MAWCFACTACIAYPCGARVARALNIVRRSISAFAYFLLQMLNIAYAMIWGVKNKPPYYSKGFVLNSIHRAMEIV